MAGLGRDNGVARSAAAPCRGERCWSSAARDSRFRGGEGRLRGRVVLSVLARHRLRVDDRPWLEEVDWFVGSANEESDLRRALDGVCWWWTPSAAATVSHRLLPERTLVNAVPTLSLLLDVSADTGWASPIFLGRNGLRAVRRPPVARTTPAYRPPTA